MSEIKTQSLLPIGELLDSTVTHFKRNYRHVLPAALGMLSLSAIISLLLIPLDFVPSQQHITPMIAMRFGVVIIVFLLLNSIFVIAITRIFGREPDTTHHTIREAIALLPSYLWIALLSGFIILGGSLLLIIPGIIFSVWFLFSQYALIIDDARGTRALVQSKHIIKGRFWAVCLRILTIILISILSMAPFAIVGNFDGLQPTITILQQIWTYIFVIPLGICFMSLLYKDLATSAEPSTIVQSLRSYVLIALIGIITIPAIIFFLVIRTLHSLFF